MMTVLSHMTVTYDYVYIHDSDRLYEEICKRKGGETCPKVGVVIVGGISVQELQGVAEKLILQKLREGVNHGRTVYKGVLIVWKQAEIRKNGYLEYRLGMTDEFNRKTLLPKDENFIL